MPSVRPFSFLPRCTQAKGSAGTERRRAGAREQDAHASHDVNHDKTNMRTGIPATSNAPAARPRARTQEQTFFSCLFLFFTRTSENAGSREETR